MPNKLSTYEARQRLELMRRAARFRALGSMKQQKKGTLNEDEATELALTAQRWARQGRHGSRVNAT